MLKDMVDKVLASGANVIICQKGIDDMAQHFLARKGVIAIRRAKKSDMEKLARATGGKIISNIDALTASDLGDAAVVEERKTGDDKMTYIEGCKNPKSVTLLIRGGNQRITAEAERINTRCTLCRHVTSLRNQEWLQEERHQKWKWQTSSKSTLKPSQAVNNLQYVSSQKP